MDSLPVGNKMENFIIAFDIDGTLISNINENVIQERRVHGQVYPFDAANTCRKHSSSRVSYSLLPYIQKRKGGCLECWWSRVCTAMG